MIYETTFEELFRQALRIRLVEEKIIEIYPSDKIQSPVHLSIGQEAVAVGACSQMRAEDLVFINYRGHAFYLAKGGPLNEMMAELYGRRGGLSGGKAGSMHLAAPQVGVMGASAVVASSLPHAVGAALAGKIQKQDRVFTAVFGDGATEEGVYHESLNFAALQQLPVLFLCENNQLAVHASLAERQAYTIDRHAAAYGVEVFELKEGYDLLKVAEKTSQAIEYIRKTGAPAVLEIHTCRYKEHVGPNDDLDAGYRAPETVTQWQALDPLCTRTDLIARFKPEIEAEIEQAIAFAEASEAPDFSDMLRDVM